jgi:hypothetical protein
MAEMPLAVRSIRHVHPPAFFGRCSPQSFCDWLPIEQLERRLAVTRRFHELFTRRQNDSHDAGLCGSRLRDAQSRRQRMHAVGRVRVLHQLLSAAKFDHRESFRNTTKSALIAG